MKADIEHIENYEAVERCGKRIYVHTFKPNVYFFIPVKNIWLIESDNHDMHFHCREGNEMVIYIVRTTLTHLWSLLPHKLFVFDNASHIINFKKMRRYSVLDMVLYFSKNTPIKLMHPVPASSMNDIGELVMKKFDMPADAHCDSAENKTDTTKKQPDTSKNH